MSLGEVSDAKLSLLWRSLVFAAPLVFAGAAQAGGEETTLNFLVTRNGDQIGTTTVRLQRDGRDRSRKSPPRFRSRSPTITVYRFEQRETERWTDGKLVGLNSVTDDNGTIHKVSADRNGDKLSVNADGKVSEVDPAIVPASLWNAQLVKKTIALNPQDGSRHAGLGDRPRQGAAGAARPRDDRAPLFDQDQFAAGCLVRRAAPAA